MKTVKSPGTTRIFIFGESAAQGDPRPQFGAGRYLKVLLEERFPGQKFEVVNTAVTAINSHVILPIARECARYQGDVWIIYMGNNEMVGPFGAATVFGRKASPLPLVRLSLSIQRLRIGQLLMGLAGKLRKQAPETSEWGGMQMFTQNEVAPADPRRERVYRNFQANLEDMLEAGAVAGAQVIVSTVAVNLKDCPPFRSARSVSRPDQQAAYDQACAAGAAASERGNYPEAAEHYRKAAGLIPESAEAHYGLAECLLALTNRPEAGKRFSLARDYDSLPFRTDSRENAILTNGASRFQSRGVILCDAAKSLAANSPAGVPGSEFLFEHVHFNTDGNYQLALSWADAVQARLPAEVQKGRAPVWATQAQCERRLALTEWNRVSLLEEMIRRLNEPPLSGQRNNTNRIAALEGQLAKLQEKIRSLPADQVKAGYLEAIQRAPDDYMLREAYAEFLQVTGDPKEEILQREKIVALTPHYYFSHLNLGLSLREQKRWPEAEQALKRAAGLNPYQAEVRLQLGSVYGFQKKYEPALREFANARRLAPRDPRPLLFAGETLWKMNRQQESVAMLREAVGLQPAYYEAHYRLGEELALLGDLQDAVAEFKEVIRLKPQHARARFNLGVAYAKMGRLEQALEEIEEVLRIDPQSQQAWQFKQQLLSDQRRR